MKEKTLTLTELLDQVILNTEFRSRDIPSIDLYMDQIIGLINSNFAKEEDDNLLTKTMIHNYSKEGLIKPVKGKKYSKEHIIQMLLVYQLKNTIKISDIKDTFKKVYSWDDYDDEFLTQCFDRHMESMETLLQKEKEFIEEMIQTRDLDLNKKEDAVLLFLYTASISYYFKSLTEKLSAFLREDL